MTTPDFILILTPQKTGSSAVRDALKSAGFATTRRRHTLRQKDRQLGLNDPRYARWLDSVAREQELVETISDPQKLVLLVTIRRDENARVISEIYWNRIELIQSHWTPSTRGFSNELQSALATYARTRMLASKSYWKDEFSRFRIDPACMEAATMHRVDDHTLLTIFEFNVLDEHFSWLIMELTGSAVALPRSNETPNGPMYADFKRFVQDLGGLDGLAAACEIDEARAPSARP